MKLSIVLFFLLACSAFGQSTYTHSLLGISFICPDQWVCRLTDGGAVFGHNTIAGLIVLSGHRNSTAQAMKAEMQQGIDEGGMFLQASGQFKAEGNQKWSTGCAGYSQEGPVKGRCFGKIVNQTGGVYVTTLSTPAGYNQELETAGKFVFNSVTIPNKSGAEKPSAGNNSSMAKPQSNLPQLFTGTWVRVSKYSQDTYRLFPNGTYSTSYEASYGGNFSNQYGKHRQLGTGHPTK